MQTVQTKSKQGHIFTCNKCNKFHFEFNQIAIDFSSIKILKNYLNYLKGLKGEEFEKLNANTLYVRKIHIPFPNTSIKMVLSQDDLEEITVLVKNFLSSYKTAEYESEMLKKLSHISECQLN